LPTGPAITLCRAILTGQARGQFPCKIDQTKMRNFEFANMLEIRICGMKVNQYCTLKTSLFAV